MSDGMFPQARWDDMKKAAADHDPRNLPDPTKAKVRIDGGGRLDAGEAAFMARQLEYIRPGVAEVQYPELKGARLIPVDTQADPGASVYTYQSFDIVGQALVTSDLSNTPPRADAFGAETSANMKSLIIAYGYSIQEARAAMLARVPLTARRAMAARSIMERTLDGIMFTGNTVGAMKGLLNLAGTLTFTATTKSGGGTSWENGTPDEIVADLNGMTNAIVTNSKEVEQPDTILLPLSLYTLISSKRMGDGDSNTILKHFLMVSPYIKTIEATHKAEDHADWTGRRCVAYRRDPNKLAFILPQPFEQLAPQATGFEVLTNCHARTAGVVAFLPKSICYTDVADAP